MADEDESTTSVSFEEVNFISIPSQTNVYGLTKVIENGYNTLLLASLKGTVLSICSPRSSRPRSISSSTVAFKNMPGNLDIVSVDAFSYSSDLTVGITFIQGAHTDYQKQYLNLYYSNEMALNLESITESCQTIELDFVPFQLYHTVIRNNKLQRSGIFLLSGSDEKIHIFGMDDSNQEFIECKTGDYYPEFQNLPGSVVWMDVYHDDHNERRISAFVCQNGFLKVVVVDEKNGNEILNQWSTMHDGPVSSVRIFTFKTEPKEISQELHDILPPSEEAMEDRKSFHILVTGVIEPSVIYQDVLKCGLSKVIILPESENYDCVVCSFVSDVDWDGNNEILIGTYGQELLVYKLFMDQDASETSEEKLQSKLCWQKSFSQPLFAIDYVDLTDDGVCELIVASSKGLHVLQHKFGEITRRFQDKFADKIKEEEHLPEIENNIMVDL